MSNILGDFSLTWKKVKMIQTRNSLGISGCPEDGLRKLISCECCHAAKRIVYVATVEAYTQTHWNIGAQILERLFWETDLKEDQSHLTSLKFLSCPWKKAAFQKEISFFYQWFLVISCQFSGGVRVYWTLGKTAKRAKCNTATRKGFSGKSYRDVPQNGLNAKLIGEKAKVKVATLQWTKPRKWTLSRRMSYWKWGFSIAMLVYQRVIPQMVALASIRYDPKVWQNCSHGGC